MANPKVLFVYYSFTQQTKHAADTMADVLRARGCDVTMAPLEFTDEHYGPRFQKLRDEVLDHRDRRLAAGPGGGRLVLPLDGGCSASKFVMEAVTDAFRLQLR